MQRFESDLIIIGCGAAGLSCAVSALENGVRVINVERAPKELMGGNSRWTEANLLLKTGPNQEAFEIADEFLELYGHFSGFHIDPDIIGETVNDYRNWSILAKTTPFLDPELLGAFADSVTPTLQWLTKNGVNVETHGERIPFCIDTLPYAKVYGGGLAIVEALGRKVEEHDRGQILYETTARELIEEDGRVIGVRCNGKRNETIELFGSVVIASGGFEGNPHMLVQYGGQKNRYLRPVSKGGHMNKGEGLRMALALNAAPAGDWSDCHRQIIDPRSGQPEAMVNIWPFGIMVNQEGVRFMDEAPNEIVLWQEEPGKQIIRQPGGIAYIIYDEKLASNASSKWRYGIRSEIPPVKADSIDALAELLAIPAETLEHTIREYNAGCVNAGNVDIALADAAPGEFDGVSTENVRPPKHNFAAPVDTPPYYCYPAVSSICFTYGGLRVNSDAQVLNASGEIIPGLYAAGETVGIHYGIYTVGTSVLRALCFGRIAGLHATRNTQRESALAVSDSQPG